MRAPRHELLRGGPVRQVTEAERRWNRLRPLWESRLRELARDRSLLVELEFSHGLTRAEQTLKRHLDREVDWYTSKLAEPDLKRLAAEARRTREIARRCARLLAKVPVAA